MNRLNLKQVFAQAAMFATEQHERDALQTVGALFARLQEFLEIQSEDCEQGTADYYDLARQASAAKDVANACAVALNPCK